MTDEKTLSLGFEGYVGSIGGGAVSSLACQATLRSGVGSLVVYDIDTLTELRQTCRIVGVGAVGISLRRVGQVGKTRVGDKLATL